MVHSIIYRDISAKFGTFRVLQTKLRCAVLFINYSVYMLCMMAAMLGVHELTSPDFLFWIVASYNGMSMYIVTYVGLMKYCILIALFIRKGVLPLPISCSFTIIKIFLIYLQNGLVPIVEPEVLCDGEHDLYTAQKVTEQVT